MMEVLELFDTRYWDFTAKHFHEKLVSEHGFKRSYNWVHLTPQAHSRKRTPTNGAPARCCLRSGFRSRRRSASRRLR